jgi:cation diffusion facilitator family transporter
MNLLALSSESMEAFSGAGDIGREELVGRRIALISMAVGTGLAVSKILVGTHVGSDAITSDGLEASGDVLSSCIVYAGLWLASRPPDSEHPYGHGRYETLAGLAVGAILLLAGAAIFWHGLSPHTTTNTFPAYALYPLLAAVVAKVCLFITKFRVGRRIASLSLEADAWHDLTDLMATGVALIAVVLTLIDAGRFHAADHIGGMVIGILICLLSVQVVHRAVSQLVDTMPDAAKMAEVRQTALLVPGARGIEKCFARRTGLRFHVDLHLEVDPDLTVRESHVIATQVRITIKETLPWVADVLVHVEPAPAALIRDSSRPIKSHNR